MAFAWNNARAWGSTWWWEAARYLLITIVLFFALVGVPGHWVGLGLAQFLFYPSQ